MARLICLLGLHGSGKTSAGRYIKAQGFVNQHISIGDLARLARSGMTPSDVSTRLMLALSKHKAGTVFGSDTAQLLATFLTGTVKQQSCISVDGFPSSPGHLHMLPNHSEIWLFEMDEAIRFARLTARSETTKRKWTHGAPSERDAQLATTLQQAKDNGMLVKTINNDGELEALHEKCLRAVYDI